MRSWLPWVACASMACGDITTEVAIGFERPRDDGPLRGVDNVTISLSPEGFTEQFAVEGADTSIEFEVPRDDVSRTLSVFFARGEALIAYGRTPPFTLAGAAGAGVVVFLGYPGRLTTLDREFDLPDASTVLAASPGRGAVALGSDGSAVFLDAYTMELIPIAPFPEEVPAAADGVFVGDATGSVTRLAYEERVTATRYVYGTDAWTSVSFEDIQPRPGAGAWYDEDAAAVYVAGGGEQTSLLRFEVTSEDGALPSVETLEPALDGPRRGAALIGRAEGGQDGLLIFGGEDPSLPLARVVASGADADLTGLAWTDARCVWLGAEQVLCAGGSIDGTTTADGAVVDVSVPSVTRLTDLLPVPMREVLWLEDDAAVYAQGEGRLLRIDRETLEVEEPQGSPARAAGGGAASLPTGATLVAGGVDAQGSANALWQLFSPVIESE